MKICFLTHDIDPKNGWGRYSVEIIERIKNKGVEVEVLTEEKKSDGLEKAVLKSGLPTPLSFFIIAFKIRKFIKDCDVIHALDGWPYGVIAAVALTGLKKRLIISGVGTYSVLPLYQKKNAWLLKWAYRKADRILCISGFTRDEIKKKVDLKNLEVINLGVDFKKFNRCSGAKPIGNEKIILSVGALKFRKGYHVSIPAVAEAKKVCPEIKYLIVGDQSNKEYFEKLKNLVRENSLEGRVEFLSGISDGELAGLYCACDLFLLASVVENHSCEGFGLVYLEANVFGKPAIGTLGCGAEDAIKDGYSGFLVPQNDIEATSRAILKVLRDENLAVNMKNSALEWAKSHSWDKTVNEYIKIYEQLIRKV